MSQVQSCAIFKSWSTTSASSLFFARFSLSSLSGSVATRRSVLPSGENSNARTPDLCFVTCQGSPPSTYMNQTCCFFSFSSPAFIRKPTILPPGDHCTSETLSSPRVYCREEPADPEVDVSHSWVTDFQGLSFSILFSATRYATREPSGEIRGENTRATRRASAVPNNFLPSLLRGAGASCFSFVSWAFAIADFASSKTQMHAAGLK